VEQEGDDAWDVTGLLERQTTQASDLNYVGDMSATEISLESKITELNLCATPNRAQGDCLYISVGQDSGQDLTPIEVDALHTVVRSSI
jgi:hypothetical protein